MTPEQRQAMMERFRAQGGGRGGQGGGRGGNQGQGGNRTAGGRGAGQGQRGNAPPQTPPAQSGADKIDELWAPVPRTQTRSQVYTWNEPAKELKMIQVVLGVSDGTFSELVTGDLKVGDQIVTGVILPLSQQKAMPGGNPFAPQQPGRMPGMTPGGPGGGNPGGGGAGGGGRGGGGGGGGRGGN
jgi:hypothetical protein